MKVPAHVEEIKERMLDDASFAEIVKEFAEGQFEGALGAQKLQFAIESVYLSVKEEIEGRS